MQRRAWAAAGVLAAAVVLAGAWQPDLVQRARSALVVEVNRGRLLIWQASWQMFTDNPWWGVGFGAFIYTFPRYRLPGDPNELTLHAHNLPLTMAVETGVFGALAFLALIVVVAWIGVARSLRGPPENRMLRIGAVAAFTGAMAHQMVDGTLQAFHLGFAFWFLIAIMVGLPAGRSHDARAHNASGTLMTATAPGHRGP
jgi:putative inorganic carbon (HCO3(-)) transporter